MTKEEHRLIHVELHQSLDLLLADFLDHTGCLLTKTSVMDLMKWSHEQTKNPIIKDGLKHDDS